MRAPCTSFAHAAATPLERVVGAKALLHVDDHQRRALAGEQAHQAPAMRERALAVHERARRRASAATRPRSRRPAKQQFSERLCQPCSPAIHSASRSTQREVGAARPTAIAGAGSPNSAAPARHPLDERLELEQRRAARARCRGRRTRSPGRSCPSEPARTGLPSPRARGGRGRWPRSRSCPPRSASTSARAVVLGGQRRVHLHARVQAAHVLFGEQQMVRASPPR